jgi:ribosomal protein L22
MTESDDTPPSGDELADEAVPAAATAADAPADEPAAAAEDDSADEDAAGPEPEDADDDEAEAEADDEEPAGEAPARRRRRPGRRRGASEPESSEPAKPSKPAPSRRRARRDPNLPAPVVRAQAKYVRSSARKARLVCDHIRGKSVEEARAILAVTPRAIAKEWSKLLESAVANAEHNHELVGEDLYVKAVHADEGPTIKRFRPRAMGRATRIRKRTSHLTILLTPKD